MKEVEYRLQLRGTSRLLMEANTELIQKRGRRGEYGNPDEWRPRVYWDEEQQAVYFPVSWLRKAGQAAASKLSKSGKDFILGVSVNPTGENSLVSVPNGKKSVPIRDIEDFAESRNGCGIYVTQGRRPPRTGNCIPIYRPILPKGWVCEFTVVPEDPLFTQEKLQEIFERAGRINGFGGGRDLGFGRFEVVSFESI